MVETITNYSNKLWNDGLQCIQCLPLQGTFPGMSGVDVFAIVVGDQFIAVAIFSLKTNLNTVTLSPNRDLIGPCSLTGLSNYLSPKMSCHFNSLRQDFFLFVG